MTYQQLEESTFDGKPLLFASFERDGVVNRFTNAVNPITIGADTYESVKGLKFPEKIARKARPQKEELIFKFPLTNSFAFSELSHSGNFSKVTIYRKHVDDSEVVTRATTFLQRAEIKGEEIDLVCSSYRANLDRIYDYSVTQKNCDYAIYGYGCGVDRSANETSLNITAISGVTLTVDTVLSDALRYQNGLLGWSGADLWIESVTGSEITLAAPSKELQAAFDASSPLAATVAFGCAKNRTDCIAFDNLLNFGGWLYIPEDETFDGTSVV